MPTLMSASTMPLSKGITAQATRLSTKVSIGAMTKTTRLAPLGMMVSLCSRLMPAAIGRSRPKGPTTLGPRLSGVETGAQLGQAVERQGAVERLRQRAQNRPVLARLARRKDRELGGLGAALGVDVGGVLLGVGRPRQDDVGAVRAGVAVMALIDDEGVAQPAAVDLVGAEQIDGIDGSLPGALADAGDGPAPRP